MGWVRVSRLRGLVLWQVDASLRLCSRLSVKEAVKEDMRPGSICINALRSESALIVP